MKLIKVSYSETAWIETRGELCVDMLSRVFVCGVSAIQQQAKISNGTLSIQSQKETVVCVSDLPK